MKKISSIILSAILILANLLIVNMLIAPIGINNNVAAFQGGDGSVGNPFQVGNVTDLQNISANLSAHYILINDIDCSVTSGWNGGLGFSPIGNDTNAGAAGKQGDNFTGSFDGKGYKIINLTINRLLENYVGLFSYIGSNGIIINATLINYSTTGKTSVSGLVGVNQGTVTDSIVKGNAIGTNNLGGLIGQNSGTVNNCDAFGDTSGNNRVAGLIGDNPTGAVVTYCNVFGNTTGNDAVGGLIGRNDATAVSNCNAYGDTDGNQYSGGLIGLNVGPVTDCTANGNITGTNMVGGLIGENWVSISNCVADGNVSGNSFLGGLIGQNEAGTITNCSAQGSAAGNSRVGGLIGYNKGEIVTDCSAFVTVKGAGDWVGGLMGHNADGPVTNCHAYGEVNGTADQIGGLIGYNQNALVTNSTSSGNVIGSGTNSDMIGGLIGLHESKIVENCTAYGNATGTDDASDYIGGLIGDNMGTVISCTAYGNAIGTGSGTPDNDIIGGLIGQNSGTVIGCTAYGSATGTDDWIGGLVGTNIGGSVENSTAYGSATGTGMDSNFIGGLIGESTGPVKNSTASGSASGPIGDSDCVGGLIGGNSDTIMNCSASGTVTGTSWYIGGLIGYNTGGMVEKCTASGIATGTGSNSDNIGGLIGYNTGYIGNSTANGNATGTDDASDYIGGLIGQNTGTVVNCTAYGDANGTGPGLTPDNDIIGGLIGQNSGNVLDCTAYGSATGTDDRIGGMVGYNNGGTIENSTAYGNATSDGDSIGGLVGYNTGNVANCTAFGNATSTNATGDGIGGLIGWNIGGAVNNCTAYGDAIGIYGFIGGLIGANLAGGTATMCRAFGDAIGTGADSDYVGGLIGIVYDGTIENCYSHGDATGDDEVGGLIGNNSAGTVKYCYSIGVVTGDVNASGLIGKNTGTVTSCFWDNETSGHTTSDGGTGKNTTEMQKAITFTSAGWDFANIWAIKQDFTYPFFGWNYWVDPPILITIDQQIALEDILYFVIYQAVDPDYEVLSWNGTTNATWLTFDENTQLLSGTPTQADIGTYYVHIIVEDPNGLTDETNFTITVLNMNDAPVITTVDVETTNEDELYTVDYNATDLDPTNDTLTWSLSTNADWLTIDPDTGILSGTPNNTHVGSFWVNVTVDDGKNDNHSTNFSLTVVNVNDDPTITSPQPPYPGAVEDTLYTIDFEAEDIDPTGDTLTWHLTTDAGWLEIDDVTGILSGTPTNADATLTFNVNVTVTDGIGGSATRIFTVYVANVNDAPSITTTDVESTPEDELYSVVYNATDIDPTDDVLTWALTTDAEWLDIDSATGNLSGTPTNDDVGNYWVNVSVDDGNLADDLHNFTLTVTNVNDDPVITTTDVTTATADELYSVDYNATDIDPTNDVLTWTLDTDASWLSIDASTGVLSGTPTNDDVWDHTVNVTVSDGNTGSDVNSFTLTVEPSGIANLNPDITTANEITATVDVEYSVTYTATDDRTLPVDLVWTMSTDAGWLSFDTTTRVLSGTPVTADLGSYWVLITVNDGEGGSASTNFTVTVSEAPANTKPDLTQGEITPTSGDTETTFTFSVHYTDADGDTPTSIKVVIDGVENDMDLASGDDADGTYEYETSLTEGNHTYYFKANDGTDDAVSSDGTPVSATDIDTTSDIQKVEEEEGEEEGLFEGTTLWIILIIVIIIILALLGLAMRKKPIEEEALLAAEEEEVIAEEMADEKELDEDKGADQDEESEDEKEEVETFECPTCGAEIAEDDTVCPECGEMFDDED